MRDHIGKQIGVLTELARGVLFPPPGRGRVALALAYGALCHAIFALAIGTMIAAMFFGMSRSLGAVPAPWDIAVSALLLVQFPLLHSVLLTGRGMRLLGRLAPAHGKTLSTTTYAILASIQLLLLFGLWTPSGIIWWQADGAAFWAICAAYAAAWVFLGLAIFDAGVELQSGALGWMSLAANRRPRFPDMPERGTFAFIRQPIYVAFALTLWTVPTWTPDQLAVAVALTAYCLGAPLLKERRFAKIYGERFARYRARVPYALPRLWRPKRDGRDPAK
jgi:protein-S-isoprenylcysteine O-methyltransferase Ste14